MIWPFPVVENTDVITLTRITNGSQPILYVVHDEDGDWQFLDGGDVSDDDAATIALKKVVELDPSIKTLADLPAGWAAEEPQISKSRGSDPNDSGRQSQTSVTFMQSCYLDNAATSWPKPELVLEAMARYHQELGVAAGRGATRAASEVEATIARCRLRAARLFDAGSSDRIIFTFNGTDSLNLAIHGCLKPGDHVIASTLEHNSVLRPLNELHSTLASRRRSLNQRPRVGSSRHDFAMLCDRTQS